MHTNIRPWLVGGVASAAVAFSATTALAQTTWHVDGANACPGSGSSADPFCAIQPAINAASNNDEVLVAPGTYNEVINLSGKAIHLLSSGGPDETTIDASGLNTSVVTCISGEGPNTILEGFTLTGGNASEGGGVRNFGASPTVINCIITGNNASFGGGISNNSGSNPTVMDCLFENNTASNDGGGIGNINFSTATINNTTFAGNSAGSGGAIFNSGGTFCNSHVADSTFCDNSPSDIFGTWHDDGGNEFLPKCPTDDCPGDLTETGEINVDDLLLVLNNWGPCPGGVPGCDGDATGTGEVNVDDLLIVLNNWGPCP